MDWMEMRRRVKPALSEALHWTIAGAIALAVSLVVVSVHHILTNAEQQKKINNLDERLKACE